jgi:hypothetical protein
LLLCFSVDIHDWLLMEKCSNWKPHFQVFLFLWCIQKD